MMLVACCMISVSAGIVDVRSCGAVGDGIADDSVALRLAVKKLHEQRGGTLAFPSGTYRFAAVCKGGGAIVVSDLSHVKIEFAPGAQLLMDNLREDGSGDGHGLVFKGKSEDIVLVNVAVKWKNKPKRRSCGDGLRFEGFPDEKQSIKKITLTDCRIENAPQTGAVLMGCSDITVTNYSSIDTLADGLHFNACRNIKVNGVKGINNGDDTLAFVTYYDDEKIGNRPGPFAQPELTAWCNTDSTAENIIAVNGRADGVRIAQGNNIKLRNIDVTGKGCGIIIDAGEKDQTHKWQYLPSRGVSIENLTVKNCNTGLFVENFSKTARFRHFEVFAQVLNITDCSNDGIHVAYGSGVKLSDLTLHRNRVRLRNASDTEFSGLRLSGASLFIDGNIAGKLSADKLPGCNIVLNNIAVEDSSVLFQNLSGLRCTGLSIKNAPETALICSNVAASKLDQVSVVNANTSGKRGVIPLRQINCRDCEIK